MARHVANVHEQLRELDKHIWGAAPMVRGARIDCWISRRDPSAGIIAVEDQAIAEGLCWSLPEAGEVGVPTRLDDARALDGLLELLWQASGGWLILESGADLGWYTQVLLEDGAPMAEVEAVAGKYAPTRLSADQRRVLLRHGFSVPGDAEARNATRNQELKTPAARQALVKTLQQVMRDAFGCEEGHPVVMRLGR